MLSIFKSKAGALVVLALLLILSGALLLTTFRQESDPFKGDAIVDPPFTSLTYSIHTFMWWNDAGQQLDWAKLMGFSHVKQIFPWKNIEPLQDEWHFERGDVIVDEAQARGIQVVVRLSDAPDWAYPSLPPRENSNYVDAPPDNLDDWGNFCGVVAERYKGRITAYQIWNEPNLSREWGDNPPDAGQYVEMLRVCSEAIRAVDPDVILISAGLSPTGNYDEIAHRDDLYLQAMYDYEFQQYVDVVGVHAPGFSVPEYGPDDSERDGGGRWATFRRIEDLRKIMVANGDAERQMAILETGYTTDQIHDSYRWFAVDEENQAINLEAAYRYAALKWRPWIGLMSSIYIAKSSWTEQDEQFWWALNDPQTGRMRPAFGALAQMEKYCGDLIMPRRTAQGSAHEMDYNPCS
jgi:polysaccharide biosynthesis protein PslG